MVHRTYRRDTISLPTFLTKIFVVTNRSLLYFYLNQNGRSSVINTRILNWFFRYFFTTLTNDPKLTLKNVWIYWKLPILRKKLFKVNSQTYAKSIVNSELQLFFVPTQRGRNSKRASSEFTSLSARFLTITSNNFIL